MRRWRNASRKRPASATGSGTYRKTFYWSRIATASGEQLNPAWTKTLGWSEAELLNRTSEWLQHPDDDEVMRAEVGKLGEAEATVRFESRFRHKDGSYRWLSWTGVSDRDHIYAVVRDITADKAAAERLKATEEALASVRRRWKRWGNSPAASRTTSTICLHGHRRHRWTCCRPVSIKGRTDNVDALHRRGDDFCQPRRRAHASSAGVLPGGSRWSRKSSMPISWYGSLEDLLRRTIGETIDLAIVASKDLWSYALRSQPGRNRPAQSRHQRPRRHAEGGKLTMETANAYLDDPCRRQSRGCAPGTM